MINIEDLKNKYMNSEEVYLYFGHYKCYLKLHEYSGDFLEFLCISSIDATTRLLGGSFSSHIYNDFEDVEGCGFQWFTKEFKKVKTLRPVTKEELQMIKELYV